MLQWISEKFKNRPKTTVRRIFLLTVVFYLLMFFALPVLAQSGAGQDIVAGTTIIQPELGMNDTDLRVVIARVIRAALGLLGIVFVVYVLYGGFVWMTAGGSDEKISAAKKIIINGTIGVAIILSAYSIASFVIRYLSSATAGTDYEGSSIRYTEENFFGSGSLGSIIKDHYPARDQMDVPRNTKIIISFKKPVLPSSFIFDTNGNSIFGDCVNVGTSMDWERDCDHLNQATDLITLTRGDTDTLSGTSTAMISYENGKAYTVIIRPLQPLGSDSVKMGYKVRIGKAVLWDDSANGNQSIFQGRPSGRDFYDWSFITDTKLDMLPPHVTDVFPGKNDVEGRNSVIQINFNKAMDPTGLQGDFSAVNNYYALKGNNIFMFAENSSMPAGTFRLVNNYRTLEFTPTTACGQNSCGNTVFCMPVCDKGTGCTQDNYRMVVRAGKTFTPNSFEAIPFSGAMDVNGNALDGNNNRVVDVVPASAGVFPEQEKFDNYFWNFNLEDKIDVTAPYLQKVVPGPEATYVTPNEEWGMLFDKRMRADSLYSIDIQETPASGELLCKWPTATYNSNNSTYVKVNHCPFLNADRHYYFPIVDSNVQDVHFNCFYPGKGPVGLEAQSKVSLTCDEAHPENCCQVGLSQDSSFCCNGLTNIADKEQCLSNLKLLSQ